MPKEILSNVSKICLKSPLCCIFNCHIYIWLLRQIVNYKCLKMLLCPESRKHEMPDVTKTLPNLKTLLFPFFDTRDISDACSSNWAEQGKSEGPQKHRNFLLDTYVYFLDKELKNISDQRGFVKTTYRELPTYPSDLSSWKVLGTSLHGPLIDCHSSDHCNEGCL